MLLEKIILQSQKEGMIGRLTILTEILGANRQIELFQFEKITSFAIKQLSSTVVRVKELGYAVLVYLYALSPEETKVIVETSPGVRGPQKKILQRAFELVDVGDIQGGLDHV